MWTGGARRKQEPWGQQVVDRQSASPDPERVYLSLGWEGLPLAMYGPSTVGPFKCCRSVALDVGYPGCWMPWMQMPWILGTMGAGYPGYRCPGCRVPWMQMQGR